MEALGASVLYKRDKALAESRQTASGGDQSPSTFRREALSARRDMYPCQSQEEGKGEKA